MLSLASSGLKRKQQQRLHVHDIAYTMPACLVARHMLTTMSCIEGVVCKVICSGNAVKRASNQVVCNLGLAWNKQVEVCTY